MATTTHIPTGIIIETELLEVLTKTLPVDLCTTMVLVCSNLGITSVYSFKLATCAPNIETFKIKFQTMAKPILRKRLFATPLMGVVNAAARIYTHLELSP